MFGNPYRKVHGDRFKTRNVCVDGRLIEVRSEADPLLLYERLTFDRGLAAIRERGYEGYIRGSDVFSVHELFKYRGQDYEFTKLHGDLFNPSWQFTEGYWLGAAIKLEDDRVHLALDPQNLYWNGRTYLLNGNRGGCWEHFSVRGISPMQAVSLDMFPMPFILMLYGARLEDLPWKSKDGKESVIYLPPENLWSPLRTFDNQNPNVLSSLTANAVVGYARGASTRGHYGIGAEFIYR